MKVLATSTLFLASQTLANDSAFNETVSAIITDAPLEGRKFISIIDMAFHRLENEPSFLQDTYSQNQNTFDTLGASKTMRQVFQSMLTNYGCHCFPQHKSTKGGKGPAVDQLDEACRTLYRCHRCIDIEDPGQCDTDQGGYNYEKLPNGQLNCDIPSRNKPECQTNQCLCDAKFADTVYDLFMNTNNDNWAFDTNYWLHGKYVKIADKNGIPVFDKNAACQAGVSSTPNKCCGDAYPDKQPYNDNDRQCCSQANKLYNPMTHECCVSSGKVSTAGAC